MQGVYFDYAATTPMNPEVVKVMQEALANDFGNASSLYKIGRDSKAKIEGVRRLIAKTLNADPDDIIFTSGGTEGNNTTLIMTSERLRSKGNHLITTAAEHSSVYETMKYLETRGFEVTYLDYDEEGHINLDELKASIRPETILLSILPGNNEVGSVQNLQAISDVADEHDLFLHMDTVQTYLNVPIDLQKLHIDAMGVSAHKLYGPKGIGFLYYRDANAHLDSFLHGGNQENEHRAGTESVPLILGMGKAIELLYDHQQEHREHLIEMRNYLLEQLKAHDIHVEINGPQKPELAHVLSLYWPGHRSDQSLILFDLKEIYLSAGSACTAGSLEPSRILVSMYGEDSPRVTESIRVSFGEPTTKEDVDRLVQAMDEINKKDVK